MKLKSDQGIVFIIGPFKTSI